MTTGEKTFLLLAIFISWAFAGLVLYLLINPLGFQLAMTLLMGGILVWLIPFAFLALFSPHKIQPIAAFALGSLGFIAIVPSLYVVLGAVLLTLGFAYWFLRIWYAKKGQTEFSVITLFSGITVFFTIIAAFAGLLYYYSPLSVKPVNAPTVPERFFDAVYQPVSTALIETGIIESPAHSAQLRPQMYRVVNAALEELARRYQGYIPFSFAFGIFLLIRAFLFVLGYILALAVHLLVQLFLKAGLIKMQTVQVPQDQLTL